MPIILEHHREHPSSRKLWLKIKERHGPRAWDYIRARRVLRKGSDGAAVRHVYETLQYLYANFDTFFTQPRVVYWPLYEADNAHVFYAFGRPRSTNKLLVLAEKLANMSLSSVVYPPVKPGGMTGFYILTNRTNALKIIGEELQAALKPPIKVLYEDFHGSKHYWDRDSIHWKKHYFRAHYPRLFDPIKAEWKPGLAMR